MSEPTEEQIASLSHDAKVILGCYFGLGRKSELNLHLQENRPTARSQIALDELVSKGILTRKPFNRFGGETYTPKIDTQPFFAWMMQNHEMGKFQFMEPIPKRGKVKP